MMNRSNANVTNKDPSIVQDEGNIDDDDDDGNDDSEDEGEEEEDIARALFFYADNLLSTFLSLRDKDKELTQAEKAFEKSKFLLLNKNPALQKILKKASTRDMSDKKVPPGSASVQRSVEDDRYILCITCINLSRIHLSIHNDLPLAVQLLREALVFYPKSTEGNYLLAMILKTQADVQGKLDIVEGLLRKAVGSREQLKVAVAAAATTAAAISSSGSSAPGISGSSSSSNSSSKIINKKVTEDDDDNDDDQGEGLTNEQLKLQLLQRELYACESAETSLSLYLCQEGRCDDARPILEKGMFKIRLSKEVLCYEERKSSCNRITNSSIDDNTISNNSSNSSSSEKDDSDKYLHVTDNILPPSMLSHLQHVFRPSSPFWSEHQYDATVNSSRTAGYFSYLYPLRDRPACNSIEQTIDHLFKQVVNMFPAAATECIVAEWWVHTRPHTSGHQLHFDSDNEGHTRSNQLPIHPICSTVLYLEEGVGGPTLMTDQLLGGPLATKGWLSFPKTNRLVLFDATYLHGVVPGRGVNPHVDRRRVTLMVGFWRNILGKLSPIDTAGPSQPFPTADSKYTWHKEMGMQKEVEGGGVEVKSSSKDLKGNSENKKQKISKDKEVERKAVKVIPQSVFPIWSKIKSGVAETREEKGDKKKAIKASLPPSYSKCFQGF